MKTERLLNAIGKIDDNLIADAESNDNGCHRSVWFRFGTMAACLALILCTVVTAKYLSSHATAGAFTLDVNPSVEYTIAKNGTVKDVSFLNSDAENALRDISLEKQSVENAVKQTVSAYVTGGIMENSNSMVLVSFDSRINSNSELKAALTSTIQNALAQTQVVETVVFHDESDDSQAKEIADELSISRGKADFILAASKRTDMTLDELAGLSLDVLMMLQDEVEIDPINPAYIGLPEAKRIALKDAGLDKEAQKVIFTKAELNSSQKEPCYFLEFYTNKNQYFYQIDAKTGDILYGREYILLENAKKIAVDDAGCMNKVTYTEETLVDGGIKTPYYRLVFADTQTRWTYRIDAVLGSILEKKKEKIGTQEFISLEEAKKIAVDDAGCTTKVTFTEETLVDGGIKTPYYRLVFADTQTRWTYRIDAVLGSILEKKKEKIGTQEFISLEEAKKIAVDDAGCTTKVTFTEETLVDGGIKTPYYRLVFADTQTRWTYRIDAVLGSILEKKKEKIGTQEFISLEEAKKIAVDDAGCTTKVTFTEETLVDGGIKTPYYRLVFADTQTRWTYRIDAVLGSVLEKNQENIGTQEFISLEEAKSIALKDAGLDDKAQKIEFTKEELNRNQGNPCYILEFNNGEYQYTYRIDAVTGNILEKNKEPILLPNPGTTFD